MNEEWLCFNGEMGSVVAIAGEDYAVIASDTRLAKYHALLSRSQPKLFRMNDRSILGVVGMRSDVLGFRDIARAQVMNYELTQERSLATQSMAHMLSVVLASRSTPYNVYSVLAGLDAQDKGCVYGLRSRGAFWKSSFCVVGSAAQFIQPILDSQIVRDAASDRTSMTLESATTLMQDVFAVACERDIYTGDSLQVSVLSRGGVQETHYPLRKD